MRLRVSASPRLRVSASPRLRVSGILLAWSQLSLAYGDMARPAYASNEAQFCAHELGVAHPAAPAVQVNGSTNALIVFVQFPDEFPVTKPCWPATNTTVPAWAHDLVQEEGQAIIPGSATDFYDEMSQGSHQFRGAVHDDVIVLGDGLATWDLDAPGAEAAVIDSLAASGIDLSPYDANGDYVVDMLVLVWRQINGIHVDTSVSPPDTTFYRLISAGSAGVSNLGSQANVTVGAYSFQENHGINIYPVTSRIDPVYVRGILLHEYGHDIIEAMNAELGAGLHGHIKSLGRYGIMDGTGADPGIGAILHTYVRYRAGWIAPRVDLDLDSTAWTDGQEQLIQLTDIATTASDGFAIVRTADPDQYFILECRDSTASPFMDGSSFGPSCGQEKAGNSGLLVTHVSGHEEIHSQGGGGCAQPALPTVEGWWLGDNGIQTEPQCDLPDCMDDCPFEACINQVFPPTLDIESSTGMLDAATWEPNPVFGYDALSCLACEDSPTQGAAVDLYGNGASNTLAPYTNPSTNLYWFDLSAATYEDVANCPIRRDQSEYSGLSFYNIGWSVQPGSGLGEMSVTVRYDAAPAAGEPFDLADGAATTVWDGDIQIMGDVRVPSGSILEIAEGSTVVFAAAQDVWAAGPETGVTELVVDGVLVVQGTAGSPVQMVGSRSSAFQHYLGQGENGQSASAGDWSGARFVDAADEGISSVRYAEFDAAFYAMTVDSLSGDLFHPKVTTSTAAVRVNAETRIVDGAEWNLDAPLTVEVDGASSEILVDGTLRTQSALPGTDWVTFTSDAPSGAGNDWAGVTFRDYAVAELYDADIGHAANPISFLGLWNKGPVVSRSSVHHYLETGILDWASAAVVETTVVNGSLALGEGDTGIHIVSSPATIRANQVTSHESFGILAEYSSGACLASPTGAPAEVVTIANNEIVGAGEESGGSQKGITLKWICHHVSAVIEENNVQQWGLYGLRFLGTTDTEVSCNCIVDNLEGVKYQTKNGLVPAADGITDFAQNNFESNHRKNTLITKGHGVSFGDGSTTGQNRFRLGDDQNARNVAITHPDNVDLPAHDCIWYDASGSLLSTQAAIDATNSDVIGEVIETDFLSSPQLCSYNSGSCALSSSMIATLEGRDSPDRPQAAGPSGGAAPPAEALSLPSVLALGRIRPNPTKGELSIRFDIPAGNRDAVELTVYDVTGRQIRRLVRGKTDPGAFDVVWDRRDDSGNRISAGVYFVRMTASSFRETRKVVVLQ